MLEAVEGEFCFLGVLMAPKIATWLDMTGLRP